MKKEKKTGLLKRDLDPRIADKYHEETMENHRFLVI
jgi:hypothetical protein